MCAPRPCKNRRVRNDDGSGPDAGTCCKMSHSDSRAEGMEPAIMRATRSRMTSNERDGSPIAERRRRLGFGAEVFDTGVDFRLSAPRCGHVSLVLEGPRGRVIAMERDAGATFSCF